MSQFRPLSETKFINDANLVSYWKLDGNSNDSKGSNNGTDTSITYNASYSPYTNFGQGALFNGFSSKITTANTTSVTGLSGITISGWIYPTSLATTDKIYLSSGLSTEDAPWYCRISTNGKLNFFVDKDASNYSYFSTTATPIVINNWYHVVMTWTGATSMAIYVNGQSLAGGYANGGTGATTMKSLNSPIHTGSLQGTSFWYAGNQDDTAIFSRALSASEVNELYQGMTLGEYLPNLNTKLLLHLNGNSTDSSGNGNNGTDTAITYSQANGKFGQGAGFNGSTSHTSIASTLGLTNNTNRTMSCWVKMNAELSGADSYGAFMAISHADIDINFRFGYWRESNVNKLAFDRGKYAVGTTQVKYNIDLGTANWYHLLMTWDGTNIIGYLNGNSVGTAGFSGNGNNGYNDYTNIGCDNNNSTGANFINTCIDEVIVEARAWSAAEVKKYYSFSRGRFGII